MNNNNHPGVIWYFRSKALNEPPYAKKYEGLLKIIDDSTRSNEYATIAISDQHALGDNAAEFQDSLRRIAEAELNLMIDGVLFHPREFDRLHWRGW